MSLGTIVYFLCATTSLIAAIILSRNYLRTRVRFLLWSSLCFVGLTLTNILLFLDMVVFPTAIDLSLVRNIPSMLGFAVLVYAFIWDVT